MHLTSALRSDNKCPFLRVTVVYYFGDSSSAGRVLQSGRRKRESGQQGWIEWVTVYTWLHLTPTYLVGHQLEKICCSVR